MYREALAARKKELGYSLKDISCRSALHLPEETISRLMSITNQHDSKIGTYLDVCGALDMPPYEPFMDPQTAAEFKLFLETKPADINNAAELSSLRERVAELEAEKAKLEAQNTLLEERIAHRDELLALHNHYNKIKRA